MKRTVRLLLINSRTFEFKGWIFFFAIVFLYLLASFYINHFILTQSLYHNTFGSQLSYSRIENIFNIRKRWQWIGFAALPLILFIRIGFTTTCLSISCYLSDIKLPFNDLFRIALVAEICLAFEMVVRIIWLTFMPINTLTDIQYFSPLSLAQLLGPKFIPKYLLYLCQTVNVFEIAYWLVLAAGLVAFLKKPFNKMFRLVMSSYGIGLLLWIIFVSYLTVTFSP